MNLQIVHSLLEELGLDQAALILESKAEQAAKGNWSYIEFINRLLEEEVAVRRKRSLVTRTRLAKVPANKTLANFDFDAQPSIDKRLIAELSTLSFLDRADNILLLGPPGVGKSHLAAALALRALEEGHTAYFITLNQLMTSLQDADVNNMLEKRIRTYLKPKLLVIDEVGYLPLDRAKANLLFQLISRRYEKGSIILTSNKSYGDCSDFLGDPVLAAAILDRLLHHSITINIKGESCRLRERRKAGVFQIYLPVLIAAFTGMRLGESLGLRWKDIDFKTRTISILQQVKKVNGEVKVGDLKTEGSARTIPVDKTLISILKSHKAKQAAHKVSLISYQDNDLVCAMPNGNPRNPGTVSSRFRRYAKQMKMPASFHDLRHTHATILYEAGVDAREIQRRLGHYDVAFTIRFYCSSM